MSFNLLVCFSHALPVYSYVAQYNENHHLCSLFNALQAGIFCIAGQSVIMGRLKRKKRKSLSTRKFLMLWQLYRQKESIFDLVDFITPHKYPFGIQTESQELIRNLICATNLQSYGIDLVRTPINDFTLSIVDKDKQVIIDQKIDLDELCPDFLHILVHELNSENSPKTRDALHQIIQPEVKRPGFTRSLLSALLASVLTEVLNSFHGLDQEGNGNLNPDEDQFNIDTQIFTSLAPLLGLEFEINRRQLNNRFRQYLDAFERDQLQLKRGRKTFPFVESIQIFEAFIRDLISQQESQHLTFELAEGSHSTGNLEDAFTQSFKQHFPKAFKLWRSGLYYFPFYEALAWAENKRLLRVQEFVIATNGSSFFERLLKGNQLSRNRSFNAVKLKAYLALDILSDHYSPSITPKQTFVGDEIQLLEVVKTDRSRFKVYLNGDRKNPIYLTQNNKAGEIIYDVAAGQEVDFRHYRKNMDYINNDPNFKLYSQTDFNPGILLEKKVDEDGNSLIGPVEGIQFRMIEE